QENGGVSKARKVGVNNAHGNYLFFLDSDDFLLEDAIRELAKEAKLHNADYIISDYIRQNDQGSFLSYVKNEGLELDRLSVMGAFFLGKIKGTLSGKLINHELFQKVVFP